MSDCSLTTCLPFPRAYFNHRSTTITAFESKDFLLGTGEKAEDTAFRFHPLSPSDVKSPAFPTVYPLCHLVKPSSTLPQGIHRLCILLSITALCDFLPQAAVFSEDVQEFSSQACLPRFHKAFGVHHKPSTFPVFMASHYIFRPWVEDGTGTALGGPGFWVQSDASSLGLHLRLLVQDLFDLDFHLCMRAFIMSRHNFHHHYIVILCGTEEFRTGKRYFHTFTFLRVVQCREKLLYPKECSLTIIAAVSHVAGGCIEDLHI